MVKRIVHRVKSDNERGARQSLMEELFYDFHRSRVQVYWMNFIRGVFFGVGTVIGGTLVVALVAWVLNLFADVPGGFGDFITYIVHTVQSSGK